MRVGVRLLRDLCWAGAVLAGIVFGTAVTAVRTASYAVAQSAVHRRRRQSPRRSGDHPLLFPARSGRAARQLQDRPGAQGALRHRPVPGRAHQPGGRPADRDRGREPGDQPGRLRGQQEAQGRPACQRGAVARPRHAFAADGAGRRAAHRRDLPAQRPVRRPGRAEDHRSAEQPRRPRVRGHAKATRPASRRSSSSATRPMATSA